MIKLDLSAFEIPYERNVKNKCQICLQSFGVTRRQHICKRCFKSVCDDCSPYKVRSYRADLHHRLHRMCKVCHIQSQVLHRYIENNKLRWGHDSDMTRLWLKQFGYKVPPKVRSSLKFKKQFSVSIEELWRSLNFSFREFVGITIDRSGVDNGQVIQTINICLSEVCHSKNLQPEKAVYLLMFFLAHSTPENAIVFTKSVLQLLSLEQPSIENITNILSLMHCTDIQSYKMQNFLQQYLPSLVQTATVNCFTAEMNIQIVSSLISKRNFEELEKGIAYVLSQRKDYICKNSSKTELILLDILRNSSSLNYRKVLKQIDQLSYKNIPSQSVNSKSETNSTLLTNQKYEKLIKENEELKIKNKNQEEEIMRLKVENSNYKEKQEKAEQQAIKKQEQKDKWVRVRKKSNMGSNNLNVPKQFDEFSQIQVELEDGESLQSYYSDEGQQQVKENIQKNKKVMRMVRANFSGFNEQRRFNSVLEQLKQRFGHKKNQGVITGKKVKKYRPKQRRRSPNFAMNNRMSMKKTKEHQRMSTNSQKMIKLDLKEIKVSKPQQKPENSYQEVVLAKNEQISKLRKELNIAKFTMKENQQEIMSIKETVTIESKQKQEKDKKIEDLKKQKIKSEQSLKGMEQMNKKLLLKMKQLSNLLMDKEQEMVEDSSKSLHELAKQYENQIKKGEGCSIF